ncbi:Beta-TrCP [Cyphellophora attinorum]|uniref:Probable E3 ubiquitin ligase complex SCF subunit sconB n=1 Tax=Cyphellophora attinorum TaxID=1664694 RepID=A0A0N0NQJ0_9EURO|nr:Beta-TrCP [Phialophora attinorum]KPI43759.1 Beta-TrCP [Phialophora attinorum]
MSNLYQSELAVGLAPSRRTSLRFAQRPRTSYASFDATAVQTLPRSRTSRWSLNPMTMSNDLLDWRTFNTNQEEEECAIASPSYPFTAQRTIEEVQRPSTSLQVPSHQRRPSQLSQSLKNGISELKSLGRRMSLTIRGKAGRPNSDAAEACRPSQLLPIRSEERMMDFSEAVSSRPRNRWNHFRTPSTRRRPSLPLLSSMQLQPWPVEDNIFEPMMPPRSRGQPILSDLVYGGAGARASAAAQNQLYQAHRATPLPPYSPPKPESLHDSESGIGIGLEELSRRPSAVDRSQPVARDPIDVLAPELVESIFSHLDLNSLLSASLVTKRWLHFASSHAVWRNVFVRDFGPKQPMPTWEGQVRHIAGMGKSLPGQDYIRLYQVRRQIDRRWDEGQAAAIYLNGHRDSVYCVQFDENKIITGSRDQTVRVWDARTYQCLRKLGPPHTHRSKIPVAREPVNPEGIQPFCSVEITTPEPAGDILVTGSSDHTCLVWDMKDNYRPIFRLVGHQLGVLDVCIDKRFIITCSKDATIKLWDRYDGQLLKTLHGHRGPVNAVQVRGNLLASASGDGMAKLWRLEDGMCIKEFQSKDRGLACVEFSEDGRTIFAGGNDKVIYEYDTITGQRVRELKGHDELVRSLHLDSANSRIISGSYDQSIKIWDVKKGESVEDGGLKLTFGKWTSSWMLSAKSNYRKIICTSQDGRVVIIDFGYGIEGVELVET